MVHHNLCFRGHVLTVCCLCCCYVLVFAFIASLCVLGLVRLIIVDSY